MSRRGCRFLMSNDPLVKTDGRTRIGEWANRRIGEKDRFSRPLTLSPVSPPRCPPLSPDLSVPGHDELGRSEFFKAHGTACMDSCRGNSYLGPEAELESVVQPRRGVHENGRCVHLALETPSVLVVIRYDGLGVLRAV